VKKRRRLSDRQKTEIIMRQLGNCWRCGESMLAEQIIAYHHINELEISGDDSIENIVAVHQHPCHDILTNGTGATTLNSSKHRIAKAKRLERLRLGTAPEKRKKKWPSRPMRRKDNGHPRRETESS
jgi:hypothetical protein